MQEQNAKSETTPAAHGRCELRPKGPAWTAAEEYGFDMSLVEENLRLTPAERIRFQWQLLELDESLRKAMEATRAQPPSPPR